VSLWLDTHAQVRPIYDRGTTGLFQALKKLNTSASVLMIGAHPDDEDTALLAYLARGKNARTAYLSLTRGDGGQNIIGQELGESLGVIRTEELLQARRLDGAEQFFTRAYDYGFSKTLAEAKEKWNEQVILCDVVRVLRHFRPLVVVSQFSGTPQDGHGQHQFAGYITPLAVKAAADLNQCGSAGSPWIVQKFYVRNRGQGEPRLRINTGDYDPVLGRSYFEIAMEARSQHKSQEQGVLELKGEQYSNLNLISGEVKETDIFEKLDTSILGVVGHIQNSEGPNRQRLEEMQKIAADAMREFDVQAPEKILPHLAKGYDLAVKGEWSTRAPGTKAFFRDKQKEFAEAIRLAAGIQLDALSDRELIVAGEAALVNVRTFLPIKEGIKGADIKLAVPDGWTVVMAEPKPPPPQQQGFFRRETGDFSASFALTVPSTESPSQPYWLKKPRKGEMFDWSSVGDAATHPFDPDVPRAVVTMDVLGTKVDFERAIEYRFADDVRGELRRNLDIVPKISVELDQALLIVPYSEKPQVRRLVMNVTNHSSKPVSGTVSLNINSPADWKYTASSTAFDLKRTGEKASITFEVVIPAKTKAGSYQIKGQAMVGELVANSTIRTIAYPHIQTHRLYPQAVTNVKVFDLKTLPIKIGYIEGSGDRVPEAIRQMGFNVEMISENDLANGNLSKYDTIVVGIRAYQVRPDVVANNKRLLDFANSGGTLIVQYQLPAYAQQNLAPYPMQIGPRVADENAPVTILQPAHPILSFPNTITDTDFAGWVQERNLYNFSTMNPKYTGLLESHDPGEAENKGGLVIADVGKGKYIYCSYSLFRQLPAGVPGAYRLFANLLSHPNGREATR
jgi:LmbE family N-acetylglucosaminyl deacetylase